MAIAKFTDPTVSPFTKSSPIKYPPVVSSAFAAHRRRPQADYREIRYVFTLRRP